MRDARNYNPRVRSKVRITDPRSALVVRRNRKRKKPIGRVNGEDLTADGYINKYGGIESNIDGKVYTSKASYMDHIKANGCVIKDY